MMKYIKRFLKITLIVILFVFSAMIAIAYFLDPNQYKNIIESKVLAQTGHVLSIKGPMTWRLSPTLMLEVNDVVLNNQKPFADELLSAKNIRIDLAMSSLFTGKVVLNLKLNGANIHLVRNNDGQSNWETLLHPKKQEIKNNVVASSNEVTHNSEVLHNRKVLQSEKNRKTTAAKEEKNILTQDKKTNKTSNSAVLLNSLKIKDGEISFQDKGKNTYYQIKDLELSMDNVMKGALGIKNPVFLSLKWLNASKNATTGKITLKADWALNLLQDELKISDLVLTLMPDLDKEKDKRSEKGKEKAPGIGKEITKLNGNILVKNMSHVPSIQGEIESRDFKLATLLDNLGLNNPALPPSLDFKAQFKYQTPYLSLDKFNIQFKNNGSFACQFKMDTSQLTAQNLNLQGEFSALNLQYNQVKLDNIAGTVVGKAGIVTIAPLIIHLAESEQQANIQIDLRGNNPKYSIRSQSNHFDIMPLLAFFGVDNKLQGKTNFKINLSASGNSAEEIKNSLSGHGEIEIKEGKLAGADLIGLLKSLNSNIYNVTSSLAKKPSLNLASSLQSLQDLWKQKQTAIHSNASTPFNLLKASVNISNGVANNPDLLISHSEYVVNGQGKLNFNNSTIEYHTEAKLKNNPYPHKDDLANYLYSSSLPINISGSFANISISPDIKTYTNNALAFAQKNFLQKSIQQEASKVVNNIVGKAMDKDKGGDQNVNKAIESTLESLLGR